MNQQIHNILFIIISLFVYMTYNLCARYDKMETVFKRIFMFIVYFNIKFNVFFDVSPLKANVFNHKCVQSQIERCAASFELFDLPASVK